MAITTDTDSTTEFLADNGASATVEDFTLEFDFEDESHCSWGIDGALEDISDDTMRAELLALCQPLDDFKAHLLLIERARERTSELEDAGEDPDRDTVVQELTAAAAKLTYCQWGCQCASDDWECTKDHYNEMLASLGDHLWAVRDTDDNEPFDDINDELDIDVLYERPAEQYSSLRRSGWSKLKLEWKDGRLTVTFDGQSIPRVELTATPLTTEQAAMADRWADVDYNSNTPASSVLDVDLDVLEEALDLWSDLTDTDVTRRWDFPDWHTGYVAAHTDAGDMSEEERAALARLAHDWDGTLPDLFITARLVCTAVAA